MNEKVAIIGIEKTLVRKCFDAGILPPAYYEKRGGQWYRPKGLTAEQQKERYPFYQIGLLLCIRNILLGFAILLIISIVLSILF